VTWALAPTCLREPLRGLFTSLAQLHVAYRVRSPAIADQRGVSIEVLSPAPDTVLERPACDVEVRVTVRPEVGRPRKLVIGGHEVDATGPRVSGRANGVDIRPGRPVEVELVLEKGLKLPLAEISVEKQPLNG